MEIKCNKGCENGWIFLPEGAKKCECYEARMTVRRLETSGMSAEFRGKDFSSFETKGDKVLTMAKKICVAYVENFPQIRSMRNNSIILMGQPGSGKTHLMAAMAREICEKHFVGFRYLEYRAEITRLKSLVLDNENYAKEILRWKDTPLLVIDDLLKGKITDADINVMFEIVNYRYLRSMPMIISTEKDADAILDFDEAVGSRILEMCKGRIIEIAGEKYNYRLC